MRFACVVIGLTLLGAMKPGVVAAQSESEASEAPAERASMPVECADGTGCFLDGRGEWQVASEAYDALIRPPKRNYLRAAIEELLFIGVGATWYYLDDSNQFDWDRPSWGARFTHEAVRLDNNDFAINFLWHPLSGAAYYGFPRANGLGVPAAAAYGLGACFLWEYVLELNEKVSINDIITTPITGIALGEFFARLARYLNRAPGGGRRVHRAFGWTLGFSQAVHDAIDDPEPLAWDAPADALGYDEALHHRFDWSHGFAYARPAEGAGYGLYEASLYGRFVAVPGHLRPGTFSGYFGDANVTSLAMRGTFNPHGSGFLMDADTVLLGYYGQSVRALPGERRRGWALVAGSSLGYGYHREGFDRYHDRVGTTRFPGVALDLDALFGRSALHVEGRLRGEFAGVHAEPYERWRAAHPDEQPKTILERHGYYYGWGWSGRASFRLDSPHVSVGGAIEHARYASQEGFDREQEEVTLDVTASDRVLDGELWLRLHPTRLLGFYLEVGAARRHRASRVGEYTADQRFDRLFARVGQVF